MVRVSTRKLLPPSTSAVTGWFLLTIHHFRGGLAAFNITFSAAGRLTVTQSRLAGPTYEFANHPAQTRAIARTQKAAHRIRIQRASFLERLLQISGHTSLRASSKS